MTRRAFATIALAGWSCATAPRPAPSAPAEPAVAAVAEPAAVAVASPDDRRRAKELADRACACVLEHHGSEAARDARVTCVRNLEATAPRDLPRSDPDVARQIERAQTCVRLAEPLDPDEEPLVVRFVQGLLGGRR